MKQLVLTEEQHELLGRMETFEQFTARMNNQYGINFEVKVEGNDVEVTMNRNHSKVATKVFPINYLFSFIREDSNLTYSEKIVQSVKIAVRLMAKKYNFC